MRPPESMTKVVDRKRYSVKTATLLAGDDYWDGHNFERSGRNSFLYKTPKGRYFTVNLTQWQGENDSLRPVNQNDAITEFAYMPEKRVEWEEAFPGVEIEDA